MACPINKVLLATFAVASVTLTSCDVEAFRGFRSDKPPVHLVQDMDFQPKVRAQSKAEFEGWKDHRGARRPVSNTFGETLVVARGSLPDAKWANKDANGQYVTQNPLALDAEFMVRGKPMVAIDRGQELYGIHCAICHGDTGLGGNGPQGHGLVGRRWAAAPPSFHFSTKDGADNRVPNMPDGEYYEVISKGVRTMPAYGARLDARERWAIVHYVRALQSLSR